MKNLFTEMSSDCKEISLFSLSIDKTRTNFKWQAYLL